MKRFGEFPETIPAGKRFILGTSFWNRIIEVDI